VSIKHLTCHIETILTPKNDILQFTSSIMKEILEKSGEMQEVRHIWHKCQLKMHQLMELNYRKIPGCTEEFNTVCIRW
jgi:hypothetical protein